MWQYVAIWLGSGEDFLRVNIWHKMLCYSVTIKAFLNLLLEQPQVLGRPKGSNGLKDSKGKGGPKGSKKCGPKGSKKCGPKGSKKCGPKGYYA